MTVGREPAFGFAAVIIIIIIIIYSLKIGAGQQGRYPALTTAHNIK